jgi:RNA polymerase sigma factor (sigma-70 family)
LHSAVDLYSTNADVIESVIRYACRCHRLSPDDADEFTSWARLRLLDHDQAVLRKFGGRSSWRTYLVSVVERLFLDWRNHEWGKWRPTAEARRIGQIAIELERLILRDGHDYASAVEQLVRRGIAPDALACDRAWARLPRQPRRQRVDEDHLVEVAPRDSEGDPIEAAERRERERTVLSALSSALAALPTADQTLLRLRYWSGIKVSQIAITSGLEQKQLYRRFERIWTDLKLRLAAAGVTAADLAEPLGYLEFEESAEFAGGEKSVEPSNLTHGGGARG